MMFRLVRMLSLPVTDFQSIHVMNITSDTLGQQEMPAIINTNPIIQHDPMLRGLCEM